MWERTIYALRDILLCVVAAAMVALPMILIAYLAARLTNDRFRFSLRTLLIVTALLATVLGLIVYAVRYANLAHHYSTDG
jgi:hypothetical protein